MTKLIVIAIGVAAALAQGAPPESPEKLMSLSHDFSNQPIPRYANGYLLAYDLQGVIRSWSYGSNGQLVTQERIALPGVDRFAIKDLTAAADGTMAVTGTAWGGEGLVSVIVWIDRAGHLLRAVRTTPFAPFRVVFDREGMLWAVGRVHDADSREAPDYDLLRRYDPQGRLIQTLLPRSGFPRGGKHPAFESFLVTAPDRVGLYCVTAGEWIEVSLRGELLGRWRAPRAVPDTGITGAALTSSGALYVSAQRMGPTQEEIQLLRLDKRSGELVPAVEIATPLGPAPLVLSSDGNSVIYYHKPGQVYRVSAVE